MDATTMEVSPAAGPLTLNGDRLNAPTTIPPTIPAMIPEKRGAPDANAIPRQRGSATRKTTTDDGRSVTKVDDSLFDSLVFIEWIKWNERQR